MYKDIITYELAEGVSSEKLMAVAKRIHQEWMKDQEGFISWEINTNSNGSYTDIVSWESNEAAAKSNADMPNVPNAGEWIGCYKEGSISSKNLTLLGEF